MCADHNMIIKKEFTLNLPNIVTNLRKEDKDRKLQQKLAIHANFIKKNRQNELEENRRKKRLNEKI